MRFHCAELPSALLAMTYHHLGIPISYPRGLKGLNRAKTNMTASHDVGAVHHFWWWWRCCKWLIDHGLPPSPPGFANQHRPFLQQHLRPFARIAHVWQRVAVSSRLRPFRSPCECQKTWPGRRLRSRFAVPPKVKKHVGRSFGTCDGTFIQPVGRKGGFPTAGSGEMGEKWPTRTIKERLLP